MKVTGAVTKMAWYSKVLYLALGSSWLYFHLLEISRPVPDVREVWENVWLVESAAGVVRCLILKRCSKRASEKSVCVSKKCI